MQISNQLREQVLAALEHLNHVLPGQAPIQDFVHHNTLHGFQHLPFEKALAEFELLTGICGYLPELKNRQFYWQGRINDEDLDSALDKCEALKPNQPIAHDLDSSLTRRELYRIALLYDLSSLTPNQWHWQVNELKALESLQANVLEAQKQQLLTLGSETEVVQQLWHSLLSKLGLAQPALHPENMLDLSHEQAQDWLEQQDADSSIPLSELNQSAARTVAELFDEVGNQLSLRGLVMALSGIDIMEQVRSHLIKFCASALDEGVAPWVMPERQTLGLYRVWRLSSRFDASLFLHELTDWQQVLESLPEDPLDTIIQQLQYFELPEIRWPGYLQRLALELPGWSGLLNWRQHHPHYTPANERHTHSEPDTGSAKTAQPPPQLLIDYLAIRITLDRLWLHQVSHDIWKIDAKFTSLQHYFTKHPAEFKVRRGLYRTRLPEYLTQKAEQLINQARSEWHNQPNWQTLAELIHTWEASPIGYQHETLTVYNAGWRLLLLAQHLGIGAAQIDKLSQRDLLGMLTLLDEFGPTIRAQVWLEAYERHYREEFLQIIRANHLRGRWAKRDTRPEAQIIFCIDEREESIRRHLEELNPIFETFGAAGFFGLPIHYQGLDDDHRVGLCPAGVAPSHEIDEIPHSGIEAILAAHQKGRKLYLNVAYLINQSLRRELWRSLINTLLLAPWLLAGQLAKSFFPSLVNRFSKTLKQRIVVQVPTELRFKESQRRSETLIHPNFSDEEQVNRVAGFLRNIGLTSGFAPIVCFMAHGSTSQNNPHEAAHDCGACSGRRGGANARLFAAIVNRPEIRILLSERAIVVPNDCWFIGAEHDTSSDAIVWFDEDQVPLNMQEALKTLKHTLVKATEASAHERCRRFYSARHPDSPPAAMQHVIDRAQDLSQVRPEYGHATNASAVVGRRSVTQGAFLDRRAFLISYDPTQDPEGQLLENILLTVGPVGAGINLEYYFSTIDNERFGCSTKIPHNITGLFGVMEGTGSDLRTGLPLQMVEIHEPMRLLMLVEAKPRVLERIYADQPGIRELVGGGWVQLAAKDPESGELYVFERGQGFVLWQAELTSILTYANSIECYRGQSVPLSPALIEQPELG